MRISRRTSGGRGEYEISGEAHGLGPVELRDRLISLDFSSLGRFNTAVALRLQGGKPRLRRIDTNGIQIPRQIAAALLLPPPVRADEALGAGHPVIQRNRYAIETVEVSSAVLLGAHEALLAPERIIARNFSNHAEEVIVADRASDIAKLWHRADEFPSEIAELLQAHHQRCASGVPLGVFDEDLVVRLQLIVAERSGDLGVIYSEAADVVPALLTAIKSQRPEPLLRIEEVDPEDVQLKRRTVKEWKRWANARGPASAKFRQEVRAAYRSTCIICGAAFPGTKATNAGVDAAHILPWSEYDLDAVTNGLCLCKQHHWAFDEAIVRLWFTDGAYFARIDSQVAESVLAEAPQFSLAELQKHEGVIATDRLPRSPQLWPAPQLLQILAEAEQVPTQ
ncbi:MAG TPA: HNH endonuclease [Thermoanaerobaculia bacterium]|jgi:hypothetical protein